MAATPTDLTRQQLDELDTLLQRMLSLPLNSADAKSAPAAPATVLPEPPPGWRIDPSAPLAAPHLPATTLTEPPRQPKRIEMPEPGPAPQAFAPTPLMAFERPMPSAPEPKVESYEVPELPDEPELPDLAELTPVTTKPAFAVPEDEFEDDATTISPMLLPLAAINWLIESGLKLFGPPGEMLTQRFAKNLLGTAGVAMILGAGLWAAYGQGWVALPTPAFMP